MIMNRDAHMYSCRAGRALHVRDCMHSGAHIWYADCRLRQLFNEDVVKTSLQVLFKCESSLFLVLAFISAL